MDFGANKTPVKVIKEGAFEGTYFRDIDSGVNGKWYRMSWKEFDQLEDIDWKYCYSNYYDVSVNKYGVECRTSLRFWKKNGWIKSKDPYGWFQWYFRYRLGRRSLDDERQIIGWKGIAGRFKDKLIKMIKDVNGRFDYYLCVKSVRIWSYPGPHFSHIFLHLDWIRRVHVSVHIQSECGKMREKLGLE